MQATVSARPFDFNWATLVALITGLIIGAAIAAVTMTVIDDDAAAIATSGSQSVTTGSSVREPGRGVAGVAGGTGDASAQAYSHPEMGEGIVGGNQSLASVGANESLGSVAELRLDREGADDFSRAVVPGSITNDHLYAGEGLVGDTNVAIEQRLSHAEMQYIEQNQLHELTGALEPPVNWAEIRLRELNELPGFTSDRQQPAQQRPVNDGRNGLTE